MERLYCIERGFLLTDGLEAPSRSGEMDRPVGNAMRGPNPCHHGQRVVVGQHLMQAASDIFLGWTHGQGTRHFYLRQLRDMKIKPLVELFKPVGLFDYAGLCGWTLARAHARSGDPAMIAGYMGKSEVFDKAIAAFGKTYADQTEQNHAAFRNAIRQGRIEVQAET